MLARPFSTFYTDVKVLLLAEAVDRTSRNARLSNILRKADNYRTIGKLVAAPRSGMMANSDMSRAASVARKYEYLRKSKKARAIVQKFSGTNQSAELINSPSSGLGKKPNDKYKKAAKLVLQRMRKKD